jgi:hypothetical protein
VEIISAFSPEQMGAIEQVGFGSLLKIKELDIRREQCKDIADSFDLDSNEFCIKGKKVKMTFKEAGHILGLPSQGEEIRGPPKKHVPELFNKYALKDSTAIYYTRMKDYFKDNESYDDDFVRLFVLFCIGFYLCPTLQTYVKSDYLGLIEDIDNIKNLNWTSLVVNYLISSIREYKEQKATNLKGNLALLQVCILLKYLKLHEIILYS